MVAKKSTKGEVKIIVCEDTYHERLRAIGALARATEQLAKALTEPQVSVSNCLFKGIGATVQGRTKGHK